MHLPIRLHKVTAAYHDGSEGEIHRSEINDQLFKQLNQTAIEKKNKQKEGAYVLPSKATRIFENEQKKREPYEPMSMDYLKATHEPQLADAGQYGINAPTTNYVLRLQHAENWRQALTARERDPILKAERQYKPAGYTPLDPFAAERGRLKQILAARTPGLANPPPKKPRPDRDPLIKGVCYAPIPACRGYMPGFIGFGGAYAGKGSMTSSRGPHHPENTTYLRGNPYSNGQIAVDRPGAPLTERTALYDLKAGSRRFEAANRVNVGSQSARGPPRERPKPKNKGKSPGAPSRTLAATQSTVSPQSPSKNDYKSPRGQAVNPVSEETLAELNYHTTYDPDMVSSTFYLSPSLFDR